jgi:hypothetical protein
MRVLRGIGQNAPDRDPIPADLPCDIAVKILCGHDSNLVIRGMPISARCKQQNEHRCYAKG